MFGRLVLLLLAATLLEVGMASDQNYTLWATVIYNRMGERTPDLLGPQSRLTTYGAQQSLAAGSFFRGRYLTSNATYIHGTNVDVLDSTQLYVMALDQQMSVASAQAFVQGLYPPVTSNSSSPVHDTIDTPLSGYQYPQLHVKGALDADYTSLGGNIFCPAFDNAAIKATSIPRYQEWRDGSRHTYEAVKTLINAEVEFGDHAFDNAASIYEYVSYLAAHNTTVASLLQYTNPTMNNSYLYTLENLASTQQQFLLANASAYNDVTHSSTLPETRGSISTIAGNMLAGLVLSRLGKAIDYSGQHNQLSVLFGDFQPMLSLFALLGLTDTSYDFLKIPNFASSAVFELYSNETIQGAFPSPDRLFVSFHYRNGTVDDSKFLQYPVFNHGPSNVDMTWWDFQALMTNISLGGVGDWCTQCGATNLFCAAWNTSLAASSALNSQPASSKLSSGAAGGIGAVVALAVAALVFGLVVLFGRVRFYRRPRNAAKELGGFKGSSKLASDRDLIIPKNGAVVGVTSVEDAEVGRERTGSWEMRETSNRERQGAEDDGQINSLPHPVEPREHI